MTRIPNLVLALGSAAGVAAIGLAVPSLAHEPADGKEVHRVIVIDGKEAGEEGAAAPDRRVEVLRLHRDGALKCEGERTEIDERTGDAERTRILLCHDAKKSSAERAERLEKALARIRADDHLSAEHRAKVEAALQTAIARLRETS